MADDEVELLASSLARCEQQARVRFRFHEFVQQQIAVVDGWAGHGYSRRLIRGGVPAHGPTEHAHTDTIDRQKTRLDQWLTP